MLSELILPEPFTKYCVNNDGNITQKHYTVDGRKILLNKITEKMFLKHLQLGIMKPIERCLLTWIGHAALLNRGYLMATVRVMYTPEIFYTDKEMEIREGRKMNVQEIVEHPELYILGQTDDTLAEKLSYTETRIEDIQNLRHTSKLTRQQPAAYILYQRK